MEYTYGTEFTPGDDVFDDMETLLALNPIKKERLRKIRGTNTYANSVNVYVGRPRSGKTYLALHDIISVVRNDKNTHLLVYINEKGECDDDTFDRFQELIDVDIVFVSYENAEKYLKNLLDYKMIYNKIQDGLSSGTLCQSEIPPEVLQELSSELHLRPPTLARAHLHTLILLEDATNAKVLRCNSSYINDLLTRCAHTQFSFFIIIHYWKALTTNIKANLSTIYIFPGYSRQQLQYMLYQMNTNCDFKELLQKYLSLPQYGKLVVDCNAAEVYRL